MAKEQSKSNSYPSRYSPNGWVRSDQYIIELICEKKAATEKKDLPVKFWQDPEWSKFFKSQLRKCNILLKKYSADSIIKALQDKKSWNIYSLFAPWLEDIIIQYEKSKKEPRLNKVEEKPQMSSGTFRKQSFQNKKNIKDILEDL